MTLPPCPTGLACLGCRFCESAREDAERAPHYADERVTVWHGDCLDVLAAMPDASIDAVVCDPPYGLEFMGREWDSFAPERTKFHGERGEGRKAISDDDSKPSSRHHVSYAMTRPTFRRCTVCGRREFSGTPCRCEAPEWTYEQPEGTPTRMAAFEKWSETWARECLRVLKPGGHLLAFGGTRTAHRLAAGIEDAGFEIRDTITWLYGTGFPKSLDVSKAIDRAAGAERDIVGRATYPDGTPVRNAAPGSKQDGWRRPWMDDDGDTNARRNVTAPATDDARRWQGWGTALKPASEPIVVARKPLAGTVAGNVLEHGTGALNIDACRVDLQGETWGGNRENAHGDYSGKVYGQFAEQYAKPSNPAGRWPANVVLTHAPDCAEDGECVPGCPVRELDEQSGVSQSDARPRPNGAPARRGSMGGGVLGTVERTGHDDTGGASRYFPTFRWQAKAATAERPHVDDAQHETVKPVDLMRWLVRLVTPPGGTVLDPFAGSGTTGEAAILEGFPVVLVEREARYLPLILARVTPYASPQVLAAARGRGARPARRPALAVGGDDLLALLDGEAPA